jgi:hypothetical protein
VLEEGMLEVECPAVTPAPVLKASGHVDRFTDFMVTDAVTGARLFFLCVLACAWGCCAWVTGCVCRPGACVRDELCMLRCAVAEETQTTNKPHQTQATTPHQTPPKPHPKKTRNKPGDCYRADHLLEGHLEKLLEDKATTAAARKEAENLLAGVGELKCEELGAALTK